MNLIHKDRAPWNLLALRISAIRCGIEQDERGVRRKPHWPDEAVLLAYVEGRLGFFTRKRVEAHLVGCSDCRGLLEDYARLGCEIGVLR